jgi:hypothetical protein
VRRLALLCVLAALPASADPPPDLDFHLLPPPAAAAPADAQRLAALDRAVGTRRRMLQAHQALGFLTASFAGFGALFRQLDYLDRFGGANTGQWEALHLGITVAGAAVLATTALLAVAAPNPYPKPIRRDTALIHKVTMTIGAAATAAEVVTDALATAYDHSGSAKSLALSALVIGYVAYACIATGWIAYFF